MKQNKPFHFNKFDDRLDFGEKHNKKEWVKCVRQFARKFIKMEINQEIK